MTATTDKLTCPECGAEYDGPQGLGAHRWHAHGVKSEETLRRERLGLRPKQRKQRRKPRPTITDGALPFACDLCDRRFTRIQGLGRHMSETHGTTLSGKPQAAKPMIESALALEVRKQLDDVTTPLRTQLAQINERLDAIARESKQLIELRREIKSVLDKLDPPPKQAPQTPQTGRESANARRAANQLDEKTDEVERYLLAHDDELSEGFTSNQLADLLTGSGAVTRGISNKSARAVLERLRDKGVVRRDRVVRGGGMRFALINGDQA